jgi:hypothetical protein
LLIFFKPRLAFLAVPKTGTTAYHTALSPHADMVLRGPPALKHAPLYRYNRFIRPMFRNVCNAELDILAVVREPVDWLGSWYRFRQRAELDGHPNSTAGLSFDDFVLAYTKGKPPPFADVGRQSKFLATQPNGTGVTHLFAYEDLGSLHRYLESKLKMKIAVSRENVSPSKDIRLSSDVAQRLRSRCAEDFDLHARALPQ